MCERAEVETEQGARKEEERNFFVEEDKAEEGERRDEERDVRGRVSVCKSDLFLFVCAIAKGKWNERRAGEREDERERAKQRSGESWRGEGEGALETKKGHGDVREKKGIGEMGC